MKQKNLFWGGILVTLGILFILKNLNIVYFNWFSILSLWPMLLVLLGVIMLPIKNNIKTILAIVVLGATVALIFSRTDYYDRNYGWNFYKWDRSDRWDDRSWDDDYDYNAEEKSENYFYEPFDNSIKEVTMDIDAVAGEFTIAKATDHLIEFNQEGNVGPYIFSTNKDGRFQKLKLDIQKRRYFKRKNLDNEVDIKLNPEPIWNFNINTGAASVDLDFSDFKTRNIDLDDGVSDVKLRLGDKTSKIKVNIDSGVSSIKILVPEDSGCEIDTDTFLASKDFEGFIKIKRGLYQTDNFDTAKNKIYINIDAAIASLEVVRY